MLDPTEEQEVEMDLGSLEEDAGGDGENGAGEVDDGADQTGAIAKGKRNNSNHNDDNNDNKRAKKTGKVSTKSKEKNVRVSNAAGLPWEVQKVLAQAIEADGGIDVFKTKPHAVRDICDRFPETFGLPGSIRRRKIRNKIKYWQKYSPEEYRSLMATLMARGPPISGRPIDARPGTKKAASKGQLQASIGQTVQEAMAKMQAHQSDLFSTKKAMKAEVAAKKLAKKKLPIRADQEYGTLCCAMASWAVLDLKFDSPLALSNALFF